MIIAIDVDDVLARSAEAVIGYHNERFGTSHSAENLESYSLEKRWGCDREEAIRRVVLFAEEGGYESLEPRNDSLAAVKILAAHHTLIALTARFSFLEETTRNWLSRHYPDCFTRVVVTNFYGTGERTTKADVCLQTRARLLIEDNLEHALPAAAAGVRVLLLDAPWNRTADLPGNVTRVSSWEEILMTTVPR